MSGWLSASWSSVEVRWWRKTMTLNIKVNLLVNDFKQRKSTCRSQTQDLNPTEMQWNDLRRAVHTRPPENIWLGGLISRVDFGVSMYFEVGKKRGRCEQSVMFTPLSKICIIKKSEEQGSGVMGISIISKVCTFIIKTPVLAKHSGVGAVRDGQCRLQVSLS